MYIFKNSIRNIFRNKSRNILIGIIIIVISATCTICLSINSSANKIVKSYEEKYKIEATIGINRFNLMNSLKESESQEDMINAFNEIATPTLEELQNYADSSYVKDFYYTYNINMNSNDVDEVTDSLVKETTTTKTETTTFGGNGRFPGGNRKTTTEKTTELIFNEKAQNGAFTLVGYDSYESMSEFISGEYIITEGEVFSDFNLNVCVISEELATLNDISVGDMISFVNPNDESKEYSFEVTGIYKQSDSESGDMSNMFSGIANNIITNVNAINKILEDDEDLILTINPTYIITSSDDVEKFKNEVVDKGLNEYYTVSDNLNIVESATDSIVNVKKFAIMFLIITFIIGSIILFVINMINIRERKYEIGVLRTIGMKKGIVMIQFMIELLIVSIISLLFGVIIGASCSTGVANKLLENEINNSNEQYQDISKNFGKENFNFNNENRKIDFNGTINIEKVNNIDAVVDFKVLAEVFGMCILLTLISSIASVISISRFSTLTILKERS